MWSDSDNQSLLKCAAIYAIMCTIERRRIKFEIFNSSILMSEDDDDNDD